MSLQLKFNFTPHGLPYIGQKVIVMNTTAICLDDLSQKYVLNSEMEVINVISELSIIVKQKAFTQYNGISKGIVKTVQVPERLFEIDKYLLI